MCGRYNLSAPSSQIIEEFELNAELDSSFQDLYPRYNIAPSQKILVITGEHGIKNRITQIMIWRFIPAWAKDLKKLPFMINARAETISTKPAFKNAFRKRRCIIPVSAFYEWKKTNNKKQPMLIQKKDKSLMGLAGIWETWMAPDGLIHNTALIITTEANPLLANIHERMPVILERHCYSPWLDCGNNNKENFDKDLLESMLKPYSGSHLEVYPVGNRINSTKFDEPGLIEKVEIN